MKKTLRGGFSVACILAGILACAAAALSLRAQQPKKSGVIRVQTNLVNILASVIDAHGQPIPDLPQDVFQLSEEGVPQKIERFEAETNRPLDLALMVDSSMSTYKDMKFEAEAAAHFVRQVVRPGDTLSVFEFDEKVTQLSEYSADVPKLQEAVRRITPGAGTSIYDAILLGSNTLRRRPGDRRRAIVMVTDAGETTSVSKFDDARRACLRGSALFHRAATGERKRKKYGGRTCADYNYGQHRRRDVHGGRNAAARRDIRAHRPRTAHAVFVGILSDSRAAAGEPSSRHVASEVGRYGALPQRILHCGRAAIKARRLGARFALQDYEQIP